MQSANAGGRERERKSERFSSRVNVVNIAKFGAISRARYSHDDDDDDDGDGDDCILNLTNRNTLFDNAKFDFYYIL